MLPSREMCSALPKGLTHFQDTVYSAMGYQIAKEEQSFCPVRKQLFKHWKMLHPADESS